MENQIKELEMSICGYDLAVNFDHVPDYSEEQVDEVFEDYFDEKYSKELLKETMEKYSGWSDGNMTNELIARAEYLIKKVNK